MRGRRIRVATSRRLPVSADGEIATRTPADFDVVPGALPVIVPGDAAPPALRSANNAAGGAFGPESVDIHQATVHLAD